MFTDISSFEFKECVPCYKRVVDIKTWVERIWGTKSFLNILNSIE